MKMIAEKTRFEYVLPTVHRSGGIQMREKVDLEKQNEGDQVVTQGEEPAEGE